MRRNRLGVILFINNPYNIDDGIDDYNYNYNNFNIRRLNRYISDINFGIRLLIVYRDEQI